MDPDVRGSVGVEPLLQVGSVQHYRRALAYIYGAYDQAFGFLEVSAVDPCAGQSGAFERAAAEVRSAKVCP